MTTAPPWTSTRWDAHVADAIVAGRRLRYLDIGQGPVLLLVHGLGASLQAWYANVADLATDHRVIAVDLPGFGHSDLAAAPADVRSYAAALADLLDWLDVERAIVVGHSLGGLIAQRMAIEHPDRVAGLVLVSTSGGRVAPRQARMFRRAAALNRAMGFARPSRRLAEPALRLLLGAEPVRRRLLAAAVHDTSFVSREMAAEIVASAYFARGFGPAILAGLSASDAGDLDRIRCPALILAGDRDRLVAPSAAAHLADRISHATVEIWEDVGHHPMMERAVAFNTRVRAFYQETGPS
jgi:pimeloyl-ACP methyl ester carboxylesterase